MFLCLHKTRPNQKNWIFSLGQLISVIEIKIVQLEYVSTCLALQILYFDINMGEPWSRSRYNFFKMKCILHKLTKEVNEQLVVILLESHILSEALQNTIKYPCKMNEFYLDRAEKKIIGSLFLFFIRNIRKKNGYILVSTLKSLFYCKST